MDRDSLEVRMGGASPSEETDPIRLGQMRLELRDWTVTVLSVGLSVVVLWLVVQTFLVFKDGGKPDQLMDLLQGGLTLLAAVIGYYFGRVPTERRAEVVEGILLDEREDRRHATWAAARAEIRMRDAAGLVRETRRLLRDKTREATADDIAEAISLLNRVERRLR